MKCQQKSHDFEVKSSFCRRILCTEKKDELDSDLIWIQRLHVQVIWRIPPTEMTAD